MPYAILGQDDSTTKEKLAKYTGVVSWGYLKPHCERKALFFVDPSLSLEAVGTAIAHNDAGKIEAWLKAGDLVKLSETHAAQWEEKLETKFEALVVSPFVLCRLAG